MTTASNPPVSTTIPRSRATPVPRDDLRDIFDKSGFDLQNHPAHIVRRVHQRAGAHFQHLMASENLSPTQFAVLATILKHEAISQTQLGRLTAMDPSTGTVVVRKLIKQGLVKRRSSTRDSRLSIISLTEAGKHFTATRLARSVEVGRALLSPLSATEQTVLIRLLKLLCADDEPTQENVDSSVRRSA